MERGGKVGMRREGGEGREEGERGEGIMARRENGRGREGEDEEGRKRGEGGKVGEMRE